MLRAYFRQVLGPSSFMGHSACVCHSGAVCSQQMTHALIDPPAKQGTLHQNKAPGLVLPPRAAITTLVIGLYPWAAYMPYELLSMNWSG